MAHILAQVAALLLILTPASCAPVTMIPVEGSVVGLSELAGEWYGTYSSPDLGRRGTLWFKLIPGETFAHGDVRMTPQGRTTPYTAHPPGSKEHQALQFLDIQFVRASAGEVTGALDQYWDPDAGCTAETIFLGRILGNRLQGSFETRLASGLVVKGSWEASRRSERVRDPTVVRSRDELVPAEPTTR